MLNDNACPTRESKNFGILEMQNNDVDVVIWSKHCYNCKKSWRT